MTIRGVHDSVSRLTTEAYVKRLNHLDKLVKIIFNDKNNEFDRVSHDASYWEGRYSALQDVLELLSECDELMEQFEDELITEGGEN